jgi:hypothetical protein
MFLDRLFVHLKIHHTNKVSNLSLRFLSINGMFANDFFQLIRTSVRLKHLPICVMNFQMYPKPVRKPLHC